MRSSFASDEFCTYGLARLTLIAHRSAAVQSLHIQTPQTKSIDAYVILAVTRQVEKVAEPVLGGILGSRLQERDVPAGLSPTQIPS